MVSYYSVYVLVRAKFYTSLLFFAKIGPITTNWLINTFSFLNFIIWFAIILIPVSWLLNFALKGPLIISILFTSGLAVRWALIWGTGEDKSITFYNLYFPSAHLALTAHIIPSHTNPSLTTILSFECSSSIITVLSYPYIFSITLTTIICSYYLSLISLMSVYPLSINNSLIASKTLIL